MPLVKPGEPVQTEPIKNPDGSYTLPPVSGYTEIELESNVGVYRGYDFYVVSPDIEGRVDGRPSSFPMERHLYKCNPAHDSEFTLVKQNAAFTIEGTSEDIGDLSPPGVVLNIGNEEVSQEKKDEFGNVLKDDFGNPVIEKIYEPRWLVLTRGGPGYFVKGSLDTGEYHQIELVSSEKLSDGLVLLGKGRVAVFEGSLFMGGGVWNGLRSFNFKPYSFKAPTDVVYGVKCFPVMTRRFMKGTSAGSGTISGHPYKKYNTEIIEVSEIQTTQGISYYDNSGLEYHTTYQTGMIKKYTPENPECVLYSETVPNTSGWVHSVAGASLERVAYPATNSVIVDGWITEVTSIVGTSTNLTGWSTTPKRIDWYYDGCTPYSIVEFSRSPAQDGRSWDPNGPYEYVNVSFYAIRINMYWSNPLQQVVYDDFPIPDGETNPYRASNYAIPQAYITSIYGATNGAVDRYDRVSYSSDGSVSVVVATESLPYPGAGVAWEAVKNPDNFLVIPNATNRHGPFAWSQSLSWASEYSDTTPRGRVAYQEFVVNAVMQSSAETGGNGTVLWASPYILSQTAYNGSRFGSVFGAGIAIMGVFPDGKWFGLSHNENGGDYQWVYTIDHGANWQAPSGWTPSEKITTVCAQMAKTEENYGDFRRCGENSALVKLGQAGWYYTKTAGATWDGAIAKPWPNPTGWPTTNVGFPVNPPYSNPYPREGYNDLVALPPGFIAQNGPESFIYAYHQASLPPTNGLSYENAFKYTDTDPDSPFYGRAFFKVKYPIDPVKKVDTVDWQTNFVDEEESERLGHTVYIYESVPIEKIEGDFTLFRSRVYIDNRLKRREDNTVDPSEPPPIAPWCKKIRIRYWVDPKYFGGCSDTYAFLIPCAIHQTCFTPGSANGHQVQLPEDWAYISWQHVSHSSFIDPLTSEDYPWVSWPSPENRLELHHPAGTGITPNARGWLIEYFGPTKPDELVAYRNPNVVKGVAGTYTRFSPQARGGTPPFTWEAEGDLPGSLNVSAGVVQGVLPNVEGDYPVTLKVTDSAEPKQSSSVGVTIRVVPNSPGGE